MISGLATTLASMPVDIAKTRLVHDCIIERTACLLRQRPQILVEKYVKLKIP